jgi:hypothetical protein
MARTGSRAGELRSYKGPLSKRITVLVPNNPKQLGTQANRRFALYRSGMTVDEYYSACGEAKENVKYAAKDIEWDQDRKFIKLS